MSDCISCSFFEHYFLRLQEAICKSNEFQTHAKTRLEGQKREVAKSEVGPMDRLVCSHVTPAIANGCHQLDSFVKFLMPHYGDFTALQDSLEWLVARSLAKYIIPFEFALERYQES